MRSRAAATVGGLLLAHLGAALADHLPDCAEAFGQSSLAVHEGSNGNLNLRDGSRVFESTGVGANASGGSSLNQQVGALCIADDDPTVPLPGVCDTFGAVTSWVASGRTFPQPPSSSYPNGPNLTVGNGQTVTIDFAGGAPVAYSRITIEDGGHLIIDDTGLSGAGEVTVKNGFTGEAGAELTLNGTAIINVDGALAFGGDKPNDPRSFITVNGVAGDTADTFTNGSISIDNTTVDVTAGTWRPIGDAKVEFGTSDLNCASTHAAGSQPATTMPECTDTDGGVFVISQSTGAIAESEFRGFFYTDGTQFNIDDSNIQGSLTGGGMTVRSSDIVPGDIPTTGDFCEEKVAAFTFDLGAGNASTCFRREVGITARDRFGQPLTNYHNEIAVSTSSNHGDWFKTDSGGNPGTNGANGTLTDTGSADDGAAQYQFVASDSGSISLFLENIHADDLTVTAQDLGTEGTSSTSGTLAFRDNVFVIDSVDANGNDIIAGRDHRFEATLWQRDSTTGDCAVPASYNDPAQPLRLWLGRHADDPGGAAPAATGVETGDSATLADSMPGSPNIQLDFSGSGATTAGRARFDLSTSDVGKYALQMLEQNSGFAVDTGGAPRAISGGSGDQVVRPFGFYMDLDPEGDGSFDDRAANASCGTQVSCATDADGDVFVAAGDAIPLLVRAVRWESADDADADGVPDSNRAIADNAATPSFGQEAVPETVDLVQALVAPAGGSAGILSGGSGVGGFSGGSVEVPGLSWDEVGIIDLQAAVSDNSYLGAADATGSLANLGRFIPADFLVTVADDGDMEVTCNAAFTYTGEAFGYATNMEPALTITARNRAGGTTTNYRGAYARLGASDVTVDAPTADSAQLGRDGVTNVPISATINTGGLVANGDGTLTYTLDSGDRFTYDKVDNARIDPFTPAFDLDVSVVDDGEASAAAPLPTAQPAATHELRFGRLAVDGAIGSELAPIDQAVRAEYWLDSTWQAHADDDCTTLALASEVQLANDQGGPVNGDQSIPVGGGSTDLVTNTADPVTLVAGRADLRFAAPGDGNTGFVETTLTLTANRPWLRHDWDDTDGGGDGPYDDLPSGRVTFGIHSGNPNWIHFRRTQ